MKAEQLVKFGEKTFIEEIKNILSKRKTKMGQSVFEASTARIHKRKAEAIAQATIRCACSVAEIIACSASVAELRRSLEPGNAAMVCGACGGKGWRRQPSRSVSPRSLTT